MTELSTGMRRLVEVACALAQQPRFLLLDEPSSGIAQSEAEALAPLLLDIRDRTGAALVVIEHDMRLVTAVADHGITPDQGRIVDRGDPVAVVDRMLSRQP